MDVKLALLLLAVGVSADPTWLSLSRKSQYAGSSTSLGIYDGQKTDITKHPYMVSLIIQNEFNCAGAIVNKNWVLTTADGIYQLPPSQLVVCAGCTDAVNGKHYQVSKIVIHPKYPTAMFDYEYACVKIIGSFQWSSKVQAITLGTAQPKVNTNLAVAGWGDASAGADSRVMREGKMKWLSPKTCASTFKPYGLNWSDRMACVCNKGKTTLCDGDWADPFVYGGKLYGLFVAGLNDGMCTGDAKPLVLNNIPAAASWIMKVTGTKYEDE